MAPWPLPIKLTSIIMETLESEAREQLPSLATVCATWRAVVESITFHTIVKSYESDDDLELLSSIFKRTGNIRHLRHLELTIKEYDSACCASALAGVLGLLSSLEEEALAHEHPGIAAEFWLWGPRWGSSSDPPTPYKCGPSKAFDSSTRGPFD
ncbi:hypothetical protein PG994_008460 [Apiospora phragmitis]|uniref:F-box domain-containing protein n=1 Tax=Apiospora phragmitis TaxID=2905665 RepID=A0ABR1UH16_9PEZI